MRNRALRGATGCVLRQSDGRATRVVHVMLSFLKMISSRYAANRLAQPPLRSVEGTQQSVTRLLHKR